MQLAAIFFCYVTLIFVICAHAANIYPNSTLVEFNFISKKVGSYGLNSRITKRSVKRNRKSKFKFSSSRKSNKLISCRKMDFNVNFVELGWEKWIIFPKVFNAHFCGGSCSLLNSPLLGRHQRRSYFNLRQSSPTVQVTNHAQIMSILEFKHPEINRQMTKCVSTKLKPLTVIFLDEYGQIKTKQYEDMIVEECGCR